MTKMAEMLKMATVAQNLVARVAICVVTVAPLLKIQYRPFFVSTFAERNQSAL